MACGCLLMSLCYAAFAVLSAQDSLPNAILAGGLAINAVVLLRKKPPSPTSG
jgi:hypothetical protein